MAAGDVAILRPHYFDAFACTGPACADNCCHTWEIDIDRTHYLRYMAESDPAFRALCRRVIRRRKQDGTPDRFAILSLGADGRCGFQDGDGGCKIYRLLGPEALCCTCAVYPRRKAQFVPGVWEFSLSLSCGEAARLALYSQEQTTFVRSRRAVRPGERLDALPSAGLGRQGGYAPAPAFAPALREAALSLIQCRAYALRERILAIGLLLRRCDRLLAAGETARIPAFCRQFFSSVEAGDFHGFFDRLDYSEAAHLAALRLPAAHLMAGARKPVLAPLWRILEPWCERDAAGNYQAGNRAMAFLLRQTREKADPFLQAHAAAAENYFVSFMFSGLFPFLYRGEGLSFEEHGILLAEQYALLRLLLALSPEQPARERMISAVVSLSRLCQHADLGHDLRALTQTVGLDGLAHAAYFLR